MHPLDLTIVLAYLAGTLGLGVCLARRVRSGADFFLAGRRLPFWAIGMSLVVSDIGALEMIGGTANAFRYGVTQANFEWIGCVPAMVIGGLIFIPLYWKLGIHSIPEFLGRTYGPLVRTLLALVALAFMAAALGIFFQASAVLLEAVLGWGRWQAILLTAAIVAVYTVGGGLGAVVATDVVQCAVLFLGGIVLAALALARAGGIDGLAAGLAARGAAAEHHLSLLQPVGLVDAAGAPFGLPWTGVLLGLGLVLSPAYWIGNQAIVQRTLGARDPWHARAAMLFGAALKILVPIAFVLPGLLGVVLLAGNGEPEPNGVYPELIRRFAPVGLRGLLYAAFLAALMSSVDSYANSAATVFVKDLLAPLRRRRGGGERFELIAGRAASLVLLAAGVAMVPLVDRFATLYDAFQSYLSYFQGPTLALLLGAVFLRGAGPAAGLACIAAGIATSAALNVAGDVHWLHVAWWSFLFALIALLAVVAAARLAGSAGPAGSATAGGGGARAERAP